MFVKYSIQLMAEKELEKGYQIILIKNLEYSFGYSNILYVIFNKIWKITNLLLHH